MFYPTSTISIPLGPLYMLFEAITNYQKVSEYDQEMP